MLGLNYNDFKGLTKQILSIIDFTTVEFNKSECSCDFVFDKYYSNNEGIIDDGILIALIDSFSSYVVLFLAPSENYKRFLSLNIKLNSFEDLKLEKDKDGKYLYKRVTVKVKMLKQFSRNILLSILILDEKGNELKNCLHLKRKIGGPKI